MYYFVLNANVKLEAYLMSRWNVKKGHLTQIMREKSIVRSQSGDRIRAGS